VKNAMTTAINAMMTMALMALASPGPV
jgi:hypothetical protein